MTDPTPAPESPAPAPPRRSARGIAAGALGEGANLVVYGSIIVSVMVTACFLIVALMMIGVISKPIEDNNAQVINNIFSSLIVLQTTVVNYWCGSSAGSARKDHVHGAVLTSTPSPAALTTGTPTP